MTVKLIPTLEEIKQSRTPLTEGERYLLDVLQNHLSDELYIDRDFHIYVQPNLFFGKPDFIIIEPAKSLWIIEVKDYSPSSYKIEIPNWTLTNGSSAKINSPYNQVSYYKEELNKSSDIDNTEKKKFGVAIRTAVYFHNFTRNNLDSLSESEEKYFTKSLVRDTVVNFEILSDLFSKTILNKYRLSKEETSRIEFIINPGFNGKNIKTFPVDPDYRRLASSQPKRQKIKGVAGSGKTSLLAKRAVDCAVNRIKKGRILVITYNITLTNYLRDKVNAENPYSSFKNLDIDIRHFHSLFEWEKKEDSDEMRIVGKRFPDEMFDAIFVDEGQDFKLSWHKILENCYLKKGKHVEYVIFADERQNIYSRIMEAEDSQTNSALMPITTIPGRWNELKKDYRCCSMELRESLTGFMQKTFNMPIEIQTGLELFEESAISGIHLRTIDSMEIEPTNQICKLIKGYFGEVVKTEAELSPENRSGITDFAILSDSRKTLMEIEFMLRNSGLNNFSSISTTFKPVKSLSEVEKVCQCSKDIRHERDKYYKLSFYRNSGGLKAATIHSFKGWEADYMVLLLNKHIDDKNSANNLSHLIYTALSRARKSILIIDKGNSGETLLAPFVKSNRVV